MTTLFLWIFILGGRVNVVAGRAADFVSVTVQFLARNFAMNVAKSVDILVAVLDHFVLRLYGLRPIVWSLAISDSLHEGIPGSLTRILIEGVGVSNLAVVPPLVLNITIKVVSRSLNLVPDVSDGFDSLQWTKDSAPPNILCLPIQLLMETVPVWLVHILVICDVAPKQARGSKSSMPEPEGLSLRKHFMKELLLLEFLGHLGQLLALGDGEQVFKGILEGKGVSVYVIGDIIWYGPWEVSQGSRGILRK
ncbi:unnamed protein product [Clonostachys chloroleuca]|uniref:Uncharacterized protein n=1 Tax=Clonostachys chloroleuca TaxID=1926264 RepID=A0AA35PXV9_9HYPO|nr:unnamed protein product [Clonostachys chloroleuca]